MSKSKSYRWPTGIEHRASSNAP